MIARALYLPQVIALFSLALAALAPAASAAPAKKPVVLSILYPISTNRDPNVATSVHLSLLYGRVGSVDGLGIHGLATLTGGDVQAVQLTGVYSQIYGKARGIHLTGVASYVMGDESGIHVTGIANVTRGKLRGVQWAGLVNMAGKGMSGIQATGLFNLADGAGRGVQLAGAGNAAGGSFDGWQVAPGFNYVSDRLVGLQFGGVNMAVRSEGTQIGLANFTTTGQGLQMGAFNSATEQKGVPFGMINLAKNGDADWITYGSNLAAVNTGIYTSVRRFYSMLTAGLPDVQGDVSNTLILTWNYGYAIPAGRATSIGLDLGFAHYIPEKTDDPNENDRLHFSLQARAMVERTFSRKAKGFIGGGVARISEEYRMDAPFETEPLVFGGVALY
ncbi:MAG TPA: hypothetical protein VFT97_06865 [Candidatus Eisenbacteria bacterium]|nr:hypothetical protein [Candidatus Eisenbacteria bacterium]